MDKNIFNINQLIEIELKTSNKNGDTNYESFSSRIEDKGKEHLFIAFPFKHGFLLPIYIGQLLQLKFMQNQIPYVADVKVISKQTSPIALLKVTMPQNIRPVQLRNWIRLPYNIPVNYKISGNEVDFSPALSLNISGGGILLQTKRSIDNGDRLDVEFQLDNVLVHAAGKVVRSCSQDNFYRVAIDFIEITEKNRDIIIGFIFYKQRELIKKGLL